MAIFKKVGIVGTGLVGGSLGLALKKKHLARTVVGTSRQEATLARARALRAIDSGATDFDILKGCDLIVLAAPVETIIRDMEKIRRVITGDCIVIDVASTKEKVVAHASTRFARFVGCHPLAGSEKRGIAFARADLFANAPCIITPVKATNRAALSAVTRLWKALGSKPVILAPRTHDRALAYMSHLPHVIAFALMAATPRGYLSLAPQSFRDITRIAGSSPELWNDIFITNKKNIVHSIDAFFTRVRALRAALINNDSRALNRIMTAAQLKRQQSL
ncbi:MAG: prephenate dehydrogenase [Candidatus Omnitrophota bacterium]